LQAKTNPVQHVPCALLGDVERSVNLPRANAVLHAGLHPYRNEPLIETKGRIFHDGSDLDAELGLRVPDPALPETARSDVSNVLRTAGRANNAVFPFRAVRNKVANAIVGVVEVYDCLLQSLWFVVYFAHRSTLAGKS
jgi:hypothetical protein